MTTKSIRSEKERMRNTSLVGTYMFLAGCAFGMGVDYLITFFAWYGHDPIQTYHDLIIGLFLIVASTVVPALFHNRTFAFKYILNYLAGSCFALGVFSLIDYNAWQHLYPTDYTELISGSAGIVLSFIILLLRKRVIRWYETGK